MSLVQLENNSSRQWPIFLFFSRQSCRIVVSWGKVAVGKSSERRVTFREMSNSKSCFAEQHRGPAFIVVGKTLLPCGGKHKKEPAGVSLEVSFE